MSLFQRAKKAFTGTRLFQKVQKAYTAKSHEYRLQKIESLKKQVLEIENLHDHLSGAQSFLLSGRVPEEWNFASFQRDHSSRLVSWRSTRTIENIPSEFIDHWTVSIKPSDLVNHVFNRTYAAVPLRANQIERLKTAQLLSVFAVKERKNLHDLPTLAIEVERHLNSKRVPHDVDAKAVKRKILNGQIIVGLTANISFEGIKAFLNARHPDSDLRSHPHIQVFDEMSAIASRKPNARLVHLNARLGSLKKKIASIHDKIASLKQK